MKFIQVIQEKLGLNNRQMAIKMRLYESGYYKSFKSSKGKVSLVNLMRLYKISGLSAQDFLDLLTAEAQELEASRPTDQRDQ